MSAGGLSSLPARWRATGQGIVSICSAHHWIIEASLTQAGGPVLIEATCNQVNQEGGYTGLTPAGFRCFVEDIARRVGFDPSRLLLGGDHLGPNPWKHLAADAAMERAGAMVAAYVEAGFTKIHLDASMACLGEPAVLAEDIVAARAARLARAAETAAKRAGVAPPVYVIGTEVPAPGGATHALAGIEVTQPKAALATLAAHREAFAAEHISEAAARVIAMVVQPGAEFGHDRVAPYDPPKARLLRTVLEREPSIVFEAHSTDYQPPVLLDALVEDGFAILKVGPALTFALREALYGLDRIAAELNPGWREHSLQSAMERLMVDAPVHWGRYYPGTPPQRRLLRHFSYSDRIRYYWSNPEAKAAVARLISELGPAPIPENLISQFLPRSYAGIRNGLVRPHPEALAAAAIGQVLSPYLSATRA